MKPSNTLLEPRFTSGHSRPMKRQQVLCKRKGTYHEAGNCNLRKAAMAIGSARYSHARRLWLAQTHKTQEKDQLFPPRFLGANWRGYPVRHILNRSTLALTEQGQRSASYRVLELAKGRKIASRRRRSSPFPSSPFVTTWTRVMNTFFLNMALVLRRKRPRHATSNDGTEERWRRRRDTLAATEARLSATSSPPSTA